MRKRPVWFDIWARGGGLRRNPQRDASRTASSMIRRLEAAMKGWEELFDELIPHWDRYTETYTGGVVGAPGFYALWDRIIAKTRYVTHYEDDQENALEFLMDAFEAMAKELSAAAMKSFDDEVFSPLLACELSWEDFFAEAQKRTEDVAASLALFAAEDVFTVERPAAARIRPAPRRNK